MSGFLSNNQMSSYGSDSNSTSRPNIMLGNNFFTTHNINRSKYVSSGKYASTFMIDANLLVKLAVNQSKTSLEKERRMAKKAANLDIGPKLSLTKKSDVFPYQNQFALVLYMDKLDGTFEQFMKSNKSNEEILRAIRDIEIKRQLLNKNDICHNDLHERNVMYKRVKVKKNAVNYEWFFIDFGSADIINNKNSCRRNITGAFDGLLMRLKHQYGTKRKPLRNITSVFKLDF